MKVEMLTKPNLVFTPVQIVSGDASYGLELLMEGTMKNLGAPSAATNFQIRVQRLNFDSGRINSAYIQDGYKLWAPDGELIAEFHTPMFLQEKATHAIQRGDLIGGWIRFILPIKANQLKSGEATLTLYWKDINDKEYSYSSNNLPPKGRCTLLQLEQVHL